MNKTEIFETIIEIIEATSDGNNLSPRHLKLTESAANGFLNNSGIEELIQVKQMIRDNNYVDWFYGIEHLTLSHNGDIKWKGVNVDSYSSSQHNSTGVDELRSRCLHIESIGLKPNARNCTFYWDEYKNLQSNIIGSAYPWVIDYYYENEGRWREISEENYNWYLGCVPPIAMSSSSFLCGEPYTHQNDGQGVYLGCRYDNGKYYAQLMTIKEYKSKTRETVNQ